MLDDRINQPTRKDVSDLEPSKVLTARDHAMTVLEYVKGYTRDRGFIGYVPHRALQAVIVNAGGRLFVNPEQLTYRSEERRVGKEWRSQLMESQEKYRDE